MIPGWKTSIALLRLVILPDRPAILLPYIVRLMSSLFTFDLPPRLTLFLPLPCRLLIFSNDGVVFSGDFVLKNYLAANQNDREGIDRFGTDLGTDMQGFQYDHTYTLIQSCKNLYSS